MRKFLMASAVAASLLASQAVASDIDVGAGDRDGAPADASSSFVGSEGILFLVISAGLIIGIAYGTNANGNVRPISP